MAKKPKTFREFVLVMATEEGRERHHPVTNPHTGWSWVDREGHGPFKRLADAKADAERVKGAIDWQRADGNGVVQGNYGPHLTADEWLARKPR